MARVVIYKMIHATSSTRSFRDNVLTSRGRKMGIWDCGQLYKNRGVPDHDGSFFPLLHGRTTVTAQRVGSPRASDVP